MCPCSFMDVDLLRDYHIYLSEFYRGGCYCKRRTNNQNELLQEVARLLLNRLCRRSSQSTQSFISSYNFFASKLGSKGHKRVWYWAFILALSFSLPWSFPTCAFTNDSDQASAVADLRSSVSSLPERVINPPLAGCPDLGPPSLRSSKQLPRSTRNSDVQSDSFLLSVFI